MREYRRKNMLYYEQVYENVHRRRRGNRRQTRAQDSEGGRFLVALLRSFLAGDAHQPTIGPTLVCRCQILPHNFRIFHPGSVGFGRPTLSPRGERRFLSSNSQPTVFVFAYRNENTDNVHERSVQVRGVHRRLSNIAPDKSKLNRP